MARYLRDSRRAGHEAHHPRGFDRQVACDTSLVATRRGRAWVERVVAHGYGDRIAAPAAYLAQSSDETGWRRLDSFGGLFGLRPRELVWGSDQPPIRMLETDAYSHGEVESRLRDSDHIAPAQLWVALGAGALLAARRPRTLDVFVAAGAQLLVGSLDTRPAVAANPGLPVDLFEALLRRTRFLCVQTEPGDPVYVVDLGWDVRR